MIRTVSESIDENGERSGVRYGSATSFVGGGKRPTYNVTICI
jgi:hypothetical protein